MRNGQICGRWTLSLSFGQPRVSSAWRRLGRSRRGRNWTERVRRIGVLTSFAEDDSDTKARFAGFLVTKGDGGMNPVFLSALISHGGPGTAIRKGGSSPK